MKTRKIGKLQLFALVGFICIALRQFAGLTGLIGEVTEWQVTIGCVVAAIGFLLYRWEIRAGFGVNGKVGPLGLGSPLFNGGIVVGLSMFFFGVTFLKGALVMGIFFIVFYLLSLLLKEKKD